MANWYLRRNRKFIQAQGRRTAAVGVAIEGRATLGLYLGRCSHLCGHYAGIGCAQLCIVGVLRSCAVDLRQREELRLATESL